MPASLFLRYLLLPLHLTVLIFIAVVALGLALARFAGLWGLPLILMFLAWVANYAFVLLEAIANGAREPPVFEIEMLNPFNESRPVFQLCLLVLIGSTVSLLAVRVGVPFAIALTSVAFIAMPASTGALAVGTSIWQCVHPGVLWHIARTMGMGYLAILAVVFGYGLIWLALARSGILLGLPLTILTVFGWLSIFALIGGSLYEHRELLGHDAIDSPERRAARVQYETDRQRARFLDRVHFEARGGNLADAWKSIELELAQQKHSLEFYDWLLQRLGERTDQRLASRLAQDYIVRTLDRDNARATQVAQRALRVDADFRPRSGAQCLRVAELLRLSGDRQSAQRLLRDFAQHFPEDPGLAQAQRMLSALDR